MSGMVNPTSYSEHAALKYPVEHDENREAATRGKKRSVGVKVGLMF